MENIDIIKKAIEKISSHPDIDKYIETYMDIPYLIINEDIKIKHNLDGTLEKLIDDFNVICNKYLINNKGYVTDLYHDIRKHGIRTYIGEKDSFGPLSLVICDIDMKWRFVFG